MRHVSQPRLRGQSSCSIDITDPRALFVWINEAREVIDDLTLVAAEALRSPQRRKLSRAAARERYRRATAAAAWLFSLKLDVPVQSQAEPRESQERAPADVIAASWQGWEA
jgi:hypothetical protein